METYTFPVCDESALLACSESNIVPVDDKRFCVLPDRDHVCQIFEPTGTGASSQPAQVDDAFMLLDLTGPKPK